MKTEVLICSVPYTNDFTEKLEAEIKRRVDGREVVSASQPTIVGTVHTVCVTVVIKNS